MSNAGATCAVWGAQEAVHADTDHFIAPILASYAFRPSGACRVDVGARRSGGVFH